MAAASSSPACASKQIIMKKSLKLIEKVAMTWTAPLMFVVFLCLSVLAIFFFLFATFLNLSGTIGAALYLIDQVKLKVVGYQLKKLVKKDKELYKFESDKENK